jgi:hypothetical protein
MICKVKELEIGEENEKTNSHRNVCTPIRERNPTVAIKSIEECEDNWCRSTALAAPVPAVPLTTKFPPTVTVFSLDTGSSTSLDIPILAISKSIIKSWYS